MPRDNIKAFLPMDSGKTRLPDLADDVIEALAEEKTHPTISPELAGMNDLVNELDEDHGDFSSEELAEAEEVRALSTATAAQRAKAKLEKPTPTSEFDHVNLGLPNYVMDQLRISCVKKKCAVRFEVLRGLKRIGYEVKPADMVADGRRSRPVRK